MLKMLFVKEKKAKEKFKARPWAPLPPSSLWRLQQPRDVRYQDRWRNNPSTCQESVGCKVKVAQWIHFEEELTGEIYQGKVIVHCSTEPHLVLLGSNDSFDRQQDAQLTRHSDLESQGIASLTRFSTTSSSSREERALFHPTFEFLIPSIGSDKVNDPNDEF